MAKIHKAVQRYHDDKRGKPRKRREKPGTYGRRIIRTVVVDGQIAAGLHATKGWKVYRNSGGSR